MAKAGKKHKPSKAASSKRLSLEDAFQRWRVLGSSELAKGDLEALLSSVFSLERRVYSDYSNGKKTWETWGVSRPDFWKDMAYLWVERDVSGVDHIRVHYPDSYYPVSVKRVDFFVWADDFERESERLYPTIATLPPAPGKEPAPTKAPKPAGGAKPSREPSSAQAARDAAIKARLDNDEIPGSTVQWDRFCHDVRTDCRAFKGDPNNPKTKFKRGFADDTIKDVTREMMKSLAL